jgi:hypothetical protein
VRVPAAEFLALDLEVHALLREVPLRDVSAVDLPGGGPGRTIADVKRLLFARHRKPRRLAGALFGLRRLIGRVLDWDRPIPEPSEARRLGEAQHRRSLVPPGTSEGPFRLLYEFENESLGEIRNATVHAFACMALAPRAGGYRFYLAVYVEPVSWFTPVYMAAIEPFRRFIVYPSMLAQLRAAWGAAHPKGRTGG